MMVDGTNVVPEVHSVLNAIKAFTNKVRAGQWKVRWCPSRLPVAMPPGVARLIVAVSNAWAVYRVSRASR